MSFSRILIAVLTFAVSFTMTHFTSKIMTQSTNSLVISLTDAMGDRERESCEVHGIKLKKNIVKVRSGLGAEPQYMPDFPYSNQFFDAGCFGAPQRYAVVLYCSECRKVQDNWNRKFNNCFFNLENLCRK